MAAFELSSNVTDCEMHCYVYLCVRINGWLRGSEGMAHTGQHLIVVGAYAYVRLDTHSEVCLWRGLEVIAKSYK